MINYSTSVTILESFRRWEAGTSPWDTEQSLLDKLSGKFTGNDKTRIGGAYHKIIENKVTEPADMVVMGVSFTADQVKAAADYSNNHPNLVNEVPGRILFETNQFFLQVSGRADAIEGLSIRDAKTKFSPPKFMEYYDSYQWRYYLDMFQVDTFYYDLFEVKGYKGNGILKDVKIVPHDPFQCIRYEHLSDDVRELTLRFANWISANHYERYLKLLK